MYLGSWHIIVKVTSRKVVVFYTFSGEFSFHYALANANINTLPIW